MQVPKDRFLCPFVSLHNCPHGGGRGLVRTAFLRHFKDRHGSGIAAADTCSLLSSSPAVYVAAEATFRRLNVWLCGVCCSLHTLRSPCRHPDGVVVSPPDDDDGNALFFIFNIDCPVLPPTAPGSVLLSPVSLNGSAPRLNVPCVDSSDSGTTRVDF